MTTGTQSPLATANREDRQVAQQLQAVESRLVERFRDRDGITEEHVRGCFQAVNIRFAGARVRTFLPILVERAVIRTLERGAATLSACL